jgi:hypothetical protein
MKRFVCLVVLAVLLAAIPASASTFLAVSRAQLVADSDAIVQGTVLKVNSFWSESGRIVVSEAMIQVEEKVRGNAPSVVVVRTYGGEVGDIRVDAPGFPKFAAGERVLVFLTNAGGTAEVTHYRQGQYRIVRDKAGVEMAVPTVEHGVRLLNRDGSAAAAPKAVRLDTFKQMLRSEIERPQTRTAN